MDAGFWLETFNLWLLLGLLLLGYGAGRWQERRHYRSLRQREEALRHIVALNTRYIPDGVAATGAVLVSGGVVISSDYFKTFVAGFRAFFGGRFRGYETLLERARREALLRLKAEAQAAGTTLVIGVRFESTAIAGSATPSVEVMAFGTALHRAP
ncbi:YbjQ family protein [Rubrivivax rivuli]|uniref:Heavy metal-binding domain-containing protein n=1 Tax=Rubrivivax rivuli TaxID=1862385 RepID=A0A437RAS9_9BURK|nr:heavy metal-binding domain-containing protein [Rubrivivax rivuli]RVU43906.1 heavy metal-binding domain-containing protein [Rubrivivax rivuli]